MINKIHHRTILPPQHAFRPLQKRLNGDLFQLLAMDVKVLAIKDSSISFIPHTTKKAKGSHAPNLPPSFI